MASGTASRQQAEANARQVLATLAALSEGTSPIELAAQLGLGQSTVYRALDRLQVQGLAVKAARGRWAAKPAAPQAVQEGPQDRAGDPVRPTGPPALQRPAQVLQRPAQVLQRPPADLLIPGDHLDLDHFQAVLDALPSEEHRAFVRLSIDVISARWHLAGQLSARWPYCAGFGTAGQGKSMMGHIDCRLLGINETLARRIPSGESPKGSLWGEHKPSGFSPSEILSYPLLWLDEVDPKKITADMRIIIRRLMEGDTQATVRTTRVHLRPTLLTCANLERLDQIPEDQQLRAFILAMEPIARQVGKEAIDDAAEAILGDLDEVAQRPGVLLPQGGTPPLPLDLLRPPQAALGEAARALIRTLISETLSPEGRALTDRTCVARAVLGRMAPDEDELAAVWAVMADVVICAQTISWTQPSWREAFDQAPEQVRKVVGRALDLARPVVSTVDRATERISKLLQVTDRQNALAAQLQTAREALTNVRRDASEVLDMESQDEQLNRLVRYLRTREDQALQHAGADLDALTTEAQVWLEAAQDVTGKLRTWTDQARAALEGELEDQDEDQDELEDRQARRAIEPRRAEAGAWSIGPATTQVLATLDLDRVSGAGPGECAMWDVRMRQPCRGQAVGRAILDPGRARAWLPVCRACAYMIRTRATERGRTVNFVGRDDLGPNNPRPQIPTDRGSLMQYAAADNTRRSAERAVQRRAARDEPGGCWRCNLRGRGQCKEHRQRVEAVPADQQMTAVGMRDAKTWASQQSWRAGG